jgi:cholesterol oxidase
LGDFDVRLRDYPQREEHDADELPLLAEQAGAQVHPLTTVASVRPLAGGGYAVETVRANSRLRHGKKTYTAEQVVFAAAALGTQKLLHMLKDNGTLPALSPRLGELTRSNSEEIVGVVAKKQGSKGSPAAITRTAPRPRSSLSVAPTPAALHPMHLTRAMPIASGTFPPS